MEEDALSPPPDFLRTHWLALLLAGISVFCIIATLVLLFKTTQISQPIRFSDDSTPATPSSQLIVVDIEGAVGKPGVYRLPVGSRVADLLDMSGGLTDEADIDWVAKTLNRAGLLSDGAKLFIPKKGVIQSSSMSTEKAEPAIPNPPAGGVGGISVNTASAAELDTLPGVGQVTAKKIIDNRPYLRLEELLEKKVLTQSVYEKVQSQISL